jgi:hypothetical protein
MAKYFYRLHDSLLWQSGSGNALIAFYNKPKSKYILKIYSIEAHVYSTSRAVEPIVAAKLSGTVFGEEIKDFAKMDSLSPNVPDKVHVYRNCQYSGTPYGIRRRTLYYSVTTSPTTTFMALNQGTFRNGVGSSLYHKRYTLYEQPITVREGETFIVYPTFPNVIVPVRVDLTFTLDYIPEATYTTSFIAMVGGDRICPIALVNESGSGRTVKIRSIIISDIGTVDTPFFKIVPLGSIALNSLYDVNRKVSNFIKYDSINPDVSSDDVEVYADVPVFPIPPISPVYAAEGGVGAPKGVSYLHTRDFLGPDYGAFFPEIRTGGVGVSRDDIGFTIRKKFCNIKGHRFGNRSPIVVRRGEIVGVVSVMETLSAWGGCAGWQYIEFGIDFALEEPEVEIEITVIDEDKNPIKDARVAVLLANPPYTQILNTLTDDYGKASTTYVYKEDTPVTVRVRKSSPPGKRYLPYETYSTITFAGLYMTVVMREDTLAS